MIRNGIDAARWLFAARRHRPAELLYVGRLSTRRARRHRRCRGSGTSPRHHTDHRRRRHRSRLVDRSGPQTISAQKHQVRRTPDHTELLALLHRADAAVLPPATTNRFVAQAAAAGHPLVTSNIGGLGERSSMTDRGVVHPAT